MTVVAPPPPTRNALPPAQRSRLMRSTRKLGEILGADPHVLEDDMVSSISSSSMSSASTSSSTCLTHHSSSSSVTSLSSDDEPSITAPPHTLRKKGSKAILRGVPSKPLFLKLNVKSRTRKASLDNSISPSSPVSPLNSFLDVRTPTQSQISLDQSSLRSKLRARRPSGASISWDFGTSGGAGVLNGTNSLSLSRSASISSVSSSAPPPISEARVRRKRMAKLKRTLGENVPVELVFGCSTTESKPQPPPIPPPSTIKARPPTPPKIKLPISPPPCLPELDVAGEDRLDPFSDPEPSTPDVLVIGPSTSSAARPISIFTTASVYSQPSPDPEDSNFTDPSPTPTPPSSSKAAAEKEKPPPRAESRQVAVLKEGSGSGGGGKKLRHKAKSLSFHHRPRPLSISCPTSPPPPMPSPSPSPFAAGKSFLSFSPSTPVPPTPLAIPRNLHIAPAVDTHDTEEMMTTTTMQQFTPRAGSHSLDLPSAYRRSQWENVPSTPAYHTHAHTAAHDVLNLGIPAFGRRKEKEWSGEWNKPDMTEVVKGLRGLKAN